jgi:hypothetical protein
MRLYISRDKILKWRKRNPNEIGMTSIHNPYINLDRLQRYGRVIFIGKVGELKALKSEIYEWFGGDQLGFTEDYDVVVYQR